MALMLLCQSIIRIASRGLMVMTNRLLLCSSWCKRSSNLWRTFTWVPWAWFYEEKNTHKHGKNTIDEGNYTLEFCSVALFVCLSFRCKILSFILLLHFFPFHFHSLTIISSCCCAFLYYCLIFKDIVYWHFLQLCWTPFLLLNIKPQTTRGILANLIPPTLYDIHGG